MWTDDLSVGISEIDHQHRELFGQLERLLDACVAGEEQEEVLKMLSFLDDYVVTHFVTEEQLQREYGYPGYHAHRAEHDHLLDAIIQFRGEVRECGPTRDFVLRLNQTLIDWLREHIMTVDRAASSWLLARLPQPADVLPQSGSAAAIMLPHEV